MGIDNPAELHNDEYYKIYTDYLFLKKTERNFWIGIFRQVISEAFGKEEE